MAHFLSGFEAAKMSEESETALNDLKFNPSDLEEDVDNERETKVSPIKKEEVDGIHRYEEIQGDLLWAEKHRLPSLNQDLIGKMFPNTCWRQESSMAGPKLISIKGQQYTRPARNRRNAKIGTESKKAINAKALNGVLKRNGITRVTKKCLCSSSTALIDFVSKIVQCLSGNVSKEDVGMALEKAGFKFDM